MILRSIHGTTVRLSTTARGRYTLPPLLPVAYAQPEDDLGDFAFPNVEGVLTGIEHAPADPLRLAIVVQCELKHVEYALGVPVAGVLSVYMIRRDAFPFEPEEWEGLIGKTASLYTANEMGHGLVIDGEVIYYVPVEKHDAADALRRHYEWMHGKMTRACTQTEIDIAESMIDPVFLPRLAALRDKAGADAWMSEGFEVFVLALASRFLKLREFRDLDAAHAAFVKIATGVTETHRYHHEAKVAAWLTMSLRCHETGCDCYLKAMQEWACDIAQNLL